MQLYKRGTMKTIEPVIAGHPLHPAIIPLPVGILPASYLLDIAALVTGNDKLWEASYYNMLIGSLSAVPAALTGLLDFSQMKNNDPAHKTALTHGLLNGGTMLLYVVNLLLRTRNRRSKWGFALSTLGAAGLVASGYLGGEIAYGRGWRVRSAERFELEWQKQQGVGAFAPEGQPDKPAEQEYPPETLRGFYEKKSGQAVFEEIQQAPTTQSKQTSHSANGLNITGHTHHEGPVKGTTKGNPAADKPSQAEGERDDYPEAAEAIDQTNSIPPNDYPSQAEGERTPPGNPHRQALG